ncbi:MAG: FliA/WhiG family RNA polymerase sigma factor [Deltaproteobacteria bacterium]|nr:FliA/WhiG family RNA polymerase sigma factor [Deltaproteobacteria bacterium]
MKQAVLRYREISRSSDNERNNKIEQYLPLVKRIAFRVSSRFPGEPTMEELVSAGVLGLIDAVDRFDVSRGKSLAGYAELRIKGAILDELRKHDVLSRQSRRRHRKLEKARQEMTNELGYVPSIEELASKLGMQEEEVQNYDKDSQPPVFLPLDSLAAFDERKVVEAREQLRFGDGENPYQNLLLKEMKQNAMDAVRALPMRLQRLVSLYYADGLTYNQIAKIMNVTESRVCQMHGDAVKKMKAYLKELEKKDRAALARPDSKPGVVSFS